MRLSESTTARPLVFALSVLTAAAAVAVQIAEGPPGSGYGWGSVVVSCVLLAVPLLFVGFVVRGGARRFAFAAVMVSALLVVVVLLALVGNWSGQPTSDRVMDAGVAVLVLATAAGVVAVELPLLHGSTPGAGHGPARNHR